MHAKIAQAQRISFPRIFFAVGATALGAKQHQIAHCPIAHLCPLPRSRQEALYRRRSSLSFVSYKPFDN
jgi:hypothetical protein